jgi:hypothetical protein
MQSLILTSTQRPHNEFTSRREVAIPIRSDESLARAIITGTYDIPTDLDPITTLILREIEKLGMKIVNGENIKITIISEEFKKFWEERKQIHLVFHVWNTLWAL